MRTFRWASCILAMLFLVLLLPMQAETALKTSSFAEMSVSPKSKVYQMLRCDNSASLSGTGKDGGETCATGDWSRPVDCAGATRASFIVREYGTGSVSVSLWNVVNVFNRNSFASISGPGVEDPASAPSPADPDPIAVSLSTGVTIDGVNTPLQLNLANTAFEYLVARIDDCTGNCDAMVVLQCDF